MKKKAKLFEGDNDKADNTDHISKLGSGGRRMLREGMMLVLEKLQ